MSVNLHYNDIAPIHPYGLPIVIVHGLLGSSSNWNSVAKALSDTHVYRVINVDLRNHGNSPHTDSMTYQEMASDIKQLMDTLSISKASFIGHSMGGKVMMAFARMFPEYIKHLIVVDIAPVTYPSTHEQLIKAMSQLDLSQVANRQDADKALQPEIPEDDIRQFLLQNLQSQNGQYQWRLNLLTLRDSLDAINGFPAEFDSAETAYPVLFVGGENSEYFQKQHVDAVVASFPAAHIIIMPNTGHWLHVEKHQQFVDMIADYVSRA